MATRQFGEYRLERLIGRGAAGEVWLARDTAERSVALKILSVTGADPDYRRRFDREARIGSRLSNPHVVPIRAFGEEQGRLFLAMAYIPGIDVAARLHAGPLGAPEAVDLVSQVADALDAAHAAGLIHRDVKPANIRVHASGFAYLIDFGIARATDQPTITATGFTVGTLAYMAPERFTGHADASSDIYALACVLYECLTAQRPFGDTDAARQLHSHLHQPPPSVHKTDPAVPAALDAVIARGMAKKSKDRYPTAGAFAAAARTAVGMTQPVPRTPPDLDRAATPRPSTGTPAEPAHHQSNGSATPAGPQRPTGSPPEPSNPSGTPAPDGPRPPTGSPSESAHNTSDPGGTPTPGGPRPPAGSPQEPAHNTSNPAGTPARGGPRPPTGGPLESAHNTSDPAGTPTPSGPRLPAGSPLESARNASNPSGTAAPGGPQRPVGGPSEPVRHGSNPASPGARSGRQLSGGVPESARNSSNPVGTPMRPGQSGGPGWPSSAAAPGLAPPPGGAVAAGPRPTEVLPASDPALSGSYTGHSAALDRARPDPGGRRIKLAAIGVGTLVVVLALIAVISALASTLGNHQPSPAAPSSTTTAPHTSPRSTTVPPKPTTVPPSTPTKPFQLPSQLQIPIPPGFPTQFHIPGQTG
ncbi:serine/threonine protein kinase [Nocardia sp. BMG111209]|uniref:serine/threonine protein kinase n=1 Tax=Nocardia sp. BMG111209 TaxID=1160137 RepID=UPI00037BA593|nr:serine/threonine protein kinase [Nocardia sp. BMG111209]